MQESKPRILIISSADPMIGPGVMSADYYKAYKSQGYEVDLLTLHKCKQHPEFLYVYDRQPSLFRRRLSKFREHPISFIKNAFSKRLRSVVYPVGSYSFFYREEENPPVPLKKVLNVITKQYDFVHILFWQGLLSFATVQALYRKLKCKFFFNCVDYSPMAGGCHFIGDCERYKVGCGCCPAYESKDPHDFTWHNVNFRKQVYKEVNPTVSGNSYMFGFYDQSVLLKKCKRIQSYPIIDLDIFKPYPKEEIRKKIGVAENKKFVLLFGCQNINDKRKGVKFLVEGVRKFVKKLDAEERKNVLIMAIGKDFDKVKSQLDEIDTLDLGYVTKEELPALYAFADVFLCSSVNDAGPMMVNQSLCCGTPVVGFEMGSCLDAVMNKGTGYCAKLKDTDDYAAGIEYIYRLSAEEKKSMKAKCLEHAKNTYSYEAAVKRVLSIF